MLPSNITPIGDRLLLQVEEEKETTVGGIIVPTTVSKTDLTGTVLSSGVGERNEQGVLLEMTVKVGDKVLFPKTASQEVTINGKKYLIVKEKDVYGIVE
jgi:chaperonin GroES